jgi:hypothetical protein
MSTFAKVAGWVTALAVLGGWSWRHARFDGSQLAVIIGLLLIVAALVVRDIDTGRVDRLADPRPLPGERP